MRKTKIQWTDSTVNFWMGCSKVSDGCKGCYMFRILEAEGKDPRKVWKTGFDTFRGAMRWREGRRIFTNSMSDFFIVDADQWREEAWEVIRKTPQHQWQILTKRPERILECLPPDWGEGWDNVWLGVSIESQKYLQRAEILASIPAKTRFISAEPLLEEVDFLALGKTLESFHWCIVGGESGDETGKYAYRPCELKWIERICNDLKPTNVKVFVKQTGTWLAKQLHLEDKYFGGKMEEWPKQIQVREFPV